VSRRRRVLLYRAIGLGDFLTGVPAYRGVIRACPDDEVTLAAPTELSGLAGLVGGMHGFVATDALAVPRWSGPPPDLAVNLHGKGPQSHRVLQALDPGWIVAFASQEAGVDGPSWHPDEHEVSRWCRLMLEHGVDADEQDLSLAAPDGPPPVAGATVVHPGAATTQRRWPADRFAAVAAHLRAQGHEVVLTGVAAERDLAIEVATRAGLPRSAVLAGRLDLVGMAALVAAARLVVCGDTGVAHLATAYSTPSIVLFGPMSPTLWGPPPDREIHQVLWRPAAVGSPSRTGIRSEPDAALMALAVDDVLRAVGRLERPAVS
jgi:ADP-heptose:LPS heptosyltransferase